MAILNYIFFYFYVRKNSTERVALTSKFVNHVVPEVVLKYVSKCGKFRQTMRTCLLDNYCMSKILRPTVVFCAKRSIYQTYISFKHATFYSNLVVHIRDHYINIPFHVESMAIVIDPNWQISCSDKDAKAGFKHFREYPFTSYSSVIPRSFSQLKH